MTTAEPRSSLPAASLDAARRADTIGQLNACLATMIDLAAAAKQAHWNVRGPQFRDLHKTFDTIAREAREWADLLAERAVTLGGTAHGTIQDAAGSTKLPQFPTDAHDAEQLIREVYSRVIICAEQLRSFAKSLDDELATQDVCVEIIRGLEMRAWMLDAHLGDHGVSARQ